MSNLEASKLYESIIEEVINDSRQDFENSGIDETTLQELKKLWREKLTQSQVAKFSWDDEQQVSHQTYSGAGVVDDDNVRQQMLMNNDLNLNSASGLELPPQMQNEQLSYGATNDPTVSAINNSNMNNNDMGIQVPNIGQSFNEYDDDNNGDLMLPSQTDGAFEISFMTDNPRATLEALKRKQKRKSHQVDGAEDEEEDDEIVKEEDDDEEDDDEGIFNDSDDINSDLDDDLESEKSDEEDGEQEGQIMLCLYDKVQRVKNKWKCNLKEGVANIDGKDYVFQKSNGESEW